MNSWMPGKNLLYAQSGGVTAVINATACGVIETARQHRDRIGTVLACRNGILGALREELIDSGQESDANVQALRTTPGGAFGSCRYKLQPLETDSRQYQRLIDVFKAHDVGAFLYNGGGDSQDTACKVQMYARQVGYPLAVIGIPKTIDNDLQGTDNCPGFGSVAKYVALSVREAAFDVASMCATSTKVFVIEVMGRHTGWIAAAAGLAPESEGKPPLVILFPEVPFEETAFLDRVRLEVLKQGYCVVVVSEGSKDKTGRFLSETETTDAFGHVQLGGAASVATRLIETQLGFKCHRAVADYLQRSARHIASATDVQQAYAVGQAAVEYVLAGKAGVIPVIKRGQGAEYSWTVKEAPLAESANTERSLPSTYISEDGFGVSAQGLAYLKPLIQGEAFPPYLNGLPRYIRLENKLVPPRLEHFDI